MPQAASSPILSVVVISYNTRSMTLDCLRSVRAQTTAPCELIVLDNASSDGSAAAIAAEFPDVMLLAEAANHGFAKANNIAATHAKGEYLLLLNPDTVVLEGALDKLLAFARRAPEARIWGGRTVFADGSPNPASCWRKMDLWNLFCRATGLTGIFPNNPVFNAEAYGGWNRMTEREVDIVTGCLFLLRRDDWQTLGGFDPAFFMYGEEADLCLRARQVIGARPRVTPEAVIVHYGGASEKVRTDKIVRLFRAKRELLRRHLPGWQQPLAFMLFDAVPLTRYLALRDGAATWLEVWNRRSEWRKALA